MLKDALAINLAFTFGCKLTQLVKFHWEYILISDLVNGKFFVNVPIPISSNSIEEEENNFKYEYI
jgi:hypothetical protein